MFALRGLAVSFSLFVIVYAPLSAVVWAVWRRLWRYSRTLSARRCADLLFTLRVVPLVVAVGATLILAVPSFLLLEPRAVNEAMGPAAAMLGLCGAAVLLTGVSKAAAALIRAWRTVVRWRAEERLTASGEKDSSSTDGSGLFSVRRISGSAPPLTATGILRADVWLSRAAESALTGDELKCALRHEFVHVRRRDNLRKLILRLAAFPGMTELESAWREASEMAADDGAVADASEALDLATAVIKLSRLLPHEPPAELSTALLSTPAESLCARVQRLLAWREPPRPQRSWPYVLCATAALFAALAVTYSELLMRVHEATEWLVR